MLGLLSPPILNRFQDQDEATRQAALDKGDLIEILLAESTERQVFVELTLRSGKSYVGLALNSGLQAHNKSDIALIPLASGYRDPETQELEITTYYATVINEWLEELEGETNEPTRRVRQRSSLRVWKIFGSSFLCQKSYRRACLISTCTSAFKMKHDCG